MKPDKEPGTRNRVRCSICGRKWTVNGIVKVAGVELRDTRGHAVTNFWCRRCDELED